MVDGEAEPWRLGDRAQAEVQLLAQLSVRDGYAALAFYERAFGAVVDYRVGGAQAGEAVVAQMSVGDAAFWVADESPAHENFSPETVGGSTARMLLVVEDPNATVERAESAGASVIRAVAREHGWLLGRIADPFGHHWEIGHPLGPWPLPGYRDQGGGVRV